MGSSTPSLERDLRSLHRLQERLEGWLARPDPELFATTPVSSWSPAQHLYHVSLANEFSLQNVASLANESGALRREPRGMRPGAAEILARGRLPGGARAPRFVSPPARLTREGLADVVGGSRDGLEAVGELRARIPAAPLAIPHQELGDLDAAGWLRFARVHTVHHLLILRAIAATLN